MKAYTSVKGLLELISEGKQPNKFWFVNDPSSLIIWDEKFKEYMYKSGSHGRFHRPIFLTIGKDAASNAKTICYEYSILDSIEKRYLHSIIQPFRNDVRSISKEVYADYTAPISYEYILIRLNTSGSHPIKHDYIQLPLFKDGTMYTGMARFKEYSLKDLEI